MSCPFCGFSEPCCDQISFGKTARRASLVVPGCFFARNPLGPSSCAPAPVNGMDTESMACFGKGAGRKGPPPAGLCRKRFSRFAWKYVEKETGIPPTHLFFREHPFLFLYSSIAPVPARMSAKPTPALRLSFSFSTRLENTMVTKMLSLSMGTTTLANPSWRAR